MLAKMAWRNLWRNRRRTLITVSSLAFGVFLATMFTALSDAQWGRAIDDSVRMLSGHVTIQHPESLDAPSLRRTVSASKALLERLAATPGVIGVKPRIVGQTMLATAADSFGASFVALDPASESAKTYLPLGDITDGKLFDADDEQGIVLGAKLAENLEAKIGRKVVYTMTDRSGEIVSALARVRGIVRTGSPSADAGLCILPLRAVRKLLGYGPDEVTQIAVYLADQRQSASMAKEIGTKLGPGAVSLSWDLVNPDLASMITLKVVGSQVLEAFVILLIAAGIFNTLFVSVMERLREFGVLLAVGFSPGRLFRLVLWESWWLALVGLAAGIAVTAAPYLYLHKYGIDLSEAYGKQGGVELGGAAFNPIMPVGIYPDHAVLIAVLITAVTLVAGLWPAWRASRVQPVEAIKLI